MSVCTQRATAAAGALATTLAPSRAFNLLGVRLHISAVGGAGSLTAKMDANAGAAYDTVLLTQDLAAISDLAWIPTQPMHFDKGDEIDFAWPNAGNLTYGIEIMYEPL
jgi:hypothetical protein